MKQIAELGPAAFEGPDAVMPYVVGHAVFADYFDFGSERWGVKRFDLEAGRIAEQLPMPECEVRPVQDGTAVPIAEGKSSLVVFLSMNAPYAPQREVLCVFDKQLRGWTVRRRAEQCPGLAAGHAPGSPVVAHLVESGASTQLELINVEDGSVRTVPSRTFAGAMSVAVNTALSHFAIAHEGGLSCMRFDGREERTWTLEGPTYRLWFAEDDLAIFRITRRALTLHQFGGADARFELPDFQPISIDLRSRSALFQKFRTREFVELDLSSGRTRSSGQLPRGHIAVDLSSRRLVELSWEQQTLKVFEL